MMTDCDVAIIGAGPYGLSIGAHLRAKGVDFRIFGTPMKTWRTQMLRDSHLKSEGWASSLYEPSGRFTLKAYCAAEGLPYADLGLPVPRATFSAYALAFQQQYVPTLDPREVVGLEAGHDDFELRLIDGETLTARRVIVAVGITHFQHVPPELAALSSEHVSHSSAHSAVEPYAGRDMVVVGAGASALDMAMELVAVGAKVRLVARRAAIRFHEPPGPRTLRDRIAAPMSGLGPGWKSRLCTDAPLLFHAMPAPFRIEVVRRHLGPAACWFTREAVEGNVEFLLGRRLEGAAAGMTATGEPQVRLRLAGDGGAVEELTADHVIAATGYRVDLRRLAFLSEPLRQRLRLCDTSPALTTQFESSVPRLFFVGVAAANSFGPLCRFAFGAMFTAPRLSAHIARTARPSPPIRSQPLNAPKSLRAESRVAETAE